MSSSSTWTPVTQVSSIDQRGVTDIADVLRVTIVRRGEWNPYEAFIEPLGVRDSGCVGRHYPSVADAQRAALDHAVILLREAEERLTHGPEAPPIPNGWIANGLERYGLAFRRIPYTLWLGADRKGTGIGGQGIWTPQVASVIRTWEFAPSQEMEEAMAHAEAEALRIVHEARAAVEALLRESEAVS